MISKVVSKVKSVFKKKPVDIFKFEPGVLDINYRVLAMAASQIGVHEFKNGSNPIIEEYLDYGKSSTNKDSGLRDDVPWCAGFVGWCLEKCGRTSMDSLMARSYEKWGVSMKHAPLPGDIVTFYRGSLKAGTGHVGFFVGFEKGHVLVLGGNQNDSVNITTYGTARMTDIRRSSMAPIYTKAQLQVLHALTEHILMGVKISPPGSVT